MIREKERYMYNVNAVTIERYLKSRYCQWSGLGASVTDRIGLLNV